MTSFCRIYLNGKPVGDLKISKELAQVIQDEINMHEFLSDKLTEILAAEMSETARTMDWTKAIHDMKEKQANLSTGDPV